MPKKMLVNMSDPDECRVAVVEDGQLAELFIERATSEHYVGNIYKGRVENVEPSIQAAFVDLGLERNGFLHVSDVNPDYLKQAHVKRNHSGTSFRACRTSSSAGRRSSSRSPRAASGPRARR